MPQRAATPLVLCIEEPILIGGQRTIIIVLFILLSVLVVVRLLVLIKHRVRAPYRLWRVFRVMCAVVGGSIPMDGRVLG